jgi:threonine synthase
MPESSMERCSVFECSSCGQRIDGPAGHDCPDADLTLSHDSERIREQFEPTGPIQDQWRYAPFLPIDPADPVSLGEGGTALVDAPTIGAEVGIDLSLKLEGANPTGSTKDRGTSILVTYAGERDLPAVACASTGNAAASLSAYAARASLPCHLFVPGDLAEGKAVQARIHGAELTTVDGSYDDAFRECARTVRKAGWADRSAGGSPYTAAGARTLGYELAEQTGPVPDWLVVPVGNGGTIADAWRGFETFADLGFASGTPRLLGVQTAATSPIHERLGPASREGREEETTCADSIDVAMPRRAEDARAAIRESDGTTVAVTDAAIRDAIGRLGQAEGVFAEPACAGAISGIERARASGIIDRGDRVVAVVTGTGLKDPQSGRSAAQADDFLS